MLLWVASGDEFQLSVVQGAGGGGESRGRHAAARGEGYCQLLLLVVITLRDFHFFWVFLVNYTNSPHGLESCVHS